MSLSFILACLWLIGANISAMLPSTDNLWRRAYILMGLGFPLLGYVIYQNGPWWGLAFFALAASLLRWPIIKLGRWILGKIG